MSGRPTSEIVSRLRGLPVWSLEERNLRIEAADRLAELDALWAAVHDPAVQVRHFGDYKQGWDEAFTMLRQVKPGWNLSPEVARQVGAAS